MNPINAAALDRAIADLPRHYPGPGGAVAVIRAGEPIVRHAWGFADLERRIAYAPSTLAPVCSITKEFTCATLLDLAPDPEAFDAAIAAQLPRLAGPRPTAADLANNQSGLRDYWALTVLCGAMPEGDFRPEDASHLLGLTRSLHFASGTAYSYSNGNFRLLANAIAAVTGRDFGSELIGRVARPAGMESAVFAPETRALPGGAVGYEGTLASGWRPGLNRIHWAGDAGLCASLDDMIAWERFADATRDDSDGLYARLARPTTFRDGSPAAYGLGLARLNRWGRSISGHGGAIRGWRLRRFYVASERLSVVLAFNHESDAYGAALHVLAAALGENDALPPSCGEAAPFAGTWLDAETGLLLDVTVGADGRLSACYDGGAETLAVGADGVARGYDMTLSRQDGALRIERPDDAIRTLARPVEPGTSDDVAGRYRSDEFEAELEIVDAGGSLFAGFRGFLGAGPLMPLTPVGRDVFRLGCRRSMDAPAPGDWTVRLSRTETGALAGLTVGCWLARNVGFARVG